MLRFEQIEQVGSSASPETPRARDPKFANMKVECLAEGGTQKAGIGTVIAAPIENRSRAWNMPGVPAKAVHVSFNNFGTGVFVQIGIRSRGILFGKEPMQ